MPSMELKASVLKNAPKLRDAGSTGVPFDPNRIFISHDLTKLQRDREFTKHQERRRRKEAKHGNTATPTAGTE